jgi:ketosteroid isomerase-like protein
MPLDRVALLEAEKTCRDLVISAAQAVDQQDYESLVSFFTDDAVVVRPGGPVLNGRSEILAAYQSKDQSRLTKHLICQQHIQVDAAGVAQSCSHVLLYVSDRNRELTPRGRSADAMQQVGVIEDQLVMTSEGWKIKNRRAWFDFFTAAQ